MYCVPSMYELGENIFCSTRVMKHDSNLSCHRGTSQISLFLMTVQIKKFLQKKSWKKIFSRQLYPYKKRRKIWVWFFVWQKLSLHETNCIDLCMSYHVGQTFHLKKWVIYSFIFAHYDSSNFIFRRLCVSSMLQNA